MVTGMEGVELGYKEAEGIRIHRDLFGHGAEVSVLFSNIGAMGLGLTRSGEVGQVLYVLNVYLEPGVVYEQKIPVRSRLLMGQA